MVGRAKTALLFVGVVALSTVAVFADEVLHGRAGADELLVDSVVGVLLAASGMLASVAIIRLTGSRQDDRRRGRMLEAVRGVGEGGHALALLSALAQQAGAMFGIESARVFIRDPEDAARYVSAAGHGASPSAETGFPLDEGPVAEAVASRAPVYDGRGELAAQGARELALPVIWAGHVRGVLLVESGPRRLLGEREIEILAALTDLGARALEHAAARGELERAAQAGVEALAAAVDVRDSYTADHSDEVVDLARRVGEQLGLSDSALRELQFAARLHDVGKIGVPDEILRKPGKLGPAEWDVVKQHTVWGGELLARVPELASVAPAVRFSHERWDGDGYPDGIAGDDIPLASRIVAACDAYHAMTSDRPYRPALGTEAARRELIANAGSQFDPLVVEALIGEVTRPVLPPLLRR